MANRKVVFIIYLSSISSLAMKIYYFFRKITAIRLILFISGKGRPCPHYYPVSNAPLVYKEYKNNKDMRIIKVIAR